MQMAQHGASTRLGIAWINGGYERCFCRLPMSLIDHGAGETLANRVMSGKSARILYLIRAWRAHLMWLRRLLPTASPKSPARHCLIFTLLGALSLR